MKMKKVVAALCALFVLLGGRTPNIPTAANTAAEDCTVYAASNVAEVVFDSEDPKKTGFSVVEPGANKTPQVYERGGEDCWVMDKLQGNAKATINFTLDSSMKSPSFDGSVYDIEVEYYDSGKGFCVLYYNNTEGRTEVYNEIYTEATNAWRTKTFTLANADFSKPVNGEYDFNLSIKNRHDNNSEYLSPESIGIRRVRVMRRPIKNKLYVSAKIDETGNTFEWFAKDKIINTNIRNVSGEDAEAEVIFRAVTDSGFVKAEITESVSLPKDESKDIELNIGSVDFCGFYYLEAEIKMSDGITFTQRPTMFTIVKTDPDGIKNKRLYVAEHLERYVEDEIIRQGVDMIRKGNFGGCRESLADRVVNIVLPELKKYGMEYLPIIWNFAETAKTNPWGLNSWAELPHTEKQYAAWRTSVEEQVLKVRDYTSRYEIWNEVNWPSFNLYLNSCRGDVFAETVKIAREVIDELDPGSTVGGMGLANMDTAYEFTSANNGKPYFDEAIKAGAGNWMQAISLHPYTWQVPEGNLTTMKSIKWYHDELLKAQPKDSDRDDVEVWLTEMGYTSADNVAKGDRRHGAMNVRQQLMYQINKVGAEISVVYNFECKGRVQIDREDMFGMVSCPYPDSRKHGTLYFPRDGYLMLTAYNYMMADSTADREITALNESNKIYVFDSQKFGKKLMTLHNKDNANDVVSFDLGTDNVEFYDIFGNMTRLYSKDGRYTFDIGEAPIYVMGDFGKIEEIDASSGNDIEINAPVDDEFVLEIDRASEEELTVEVELPQCATKTETPVFKDNKAIVKIKNGADLGESYEVIVRLKSGDKTVYSRTYRINSSFAATSTISAKPTSDDYYSWGAEVKLNNVSRTKALTGHIEVKDGELAKNLKKIDIGLIPAGCTGLVEFNLGRILKKGIYPIEYDLVLSTGERYSYSNTFDMSFAKYADTKPVIDGEITEEEWSFGTAMVIDSKSNIKQIADWRGKDDLSGMAMVMWDEENMYFAAEVTDDIFVPAEPAANQWKGDDIQLGIYYGSDGLIVIGQGSNTYHELGLAKTTEGDQIWRWLSQDNSLPTGAVTGMELKVKRTGNKTCYEARLPWKSLLKEGQQPKEGHEIAFNFIFNDNDGTGRRGWMEYTPGIGESKNTQLFSKVKLLGK